MWKALIIPAAALAVGMTAGCNPNSGGGTGAAVPSRAAASTQAAARQLAAAEPFEALTETAFTATRAELEAAARKAEDAADGVRGELPIGAARQLTSQIAEIRAALPRGNRADLAIASVEAYRTLVSAAPHTKVPLAVSLLDYAGFRYQADLGAKPVRWTDMVEAASFARGQWDSLSPQVTDTALRSRVDQAVEALRIAEAEHDSSRADHAARTLLDLVDELEAQFNARPSSR